MLNRYATMYGKVKPVKDYSVDEDETYATRKTEQMRNKTLSGNHYVQPMESKFNVSVDDDPLGTRWAQGHRS